MLSPWFVVVVVVVVVGYSGEWWYVVAVVGDVILAAGEQQFNTCKNTSNKEHRQHKTLIKIKKHQSLLRKIFKQQHVTSNRIVVVVAL
jgi:hypothetical protein